MIDLLDAPKSRTRTRAARVRSLAELFFRRLSQSTYARRREARRARPLYFESLESRILLSSDPILSAISHDAYVSLQDDTAIIDVPFLLGLLAWSIRYSIRTFRGTEEWERLFGTS